MSNLANKIDKVLPQTQCRLCQHPSCLDYANAISNGKDTIDKCHPGGVKTLEKLAELTNTTSQQFINKVATQYKEPSIVKIDEDKCIGCTKCITACPVDAIIGSAKKMHSIITNICSGCDLCIPACPVDCIETIPNNDNINKAEMFKSRFIAKKAREEANSIKKSQEYKKNKIGTSNNSQDIDARKAAIAAAVARVTNKRLQVNHNE